MQDCKEMKKADQLIITKEDTQQARYLPEETRTVTIQNNKVATHKACLATWQSRWMNASTGRQYHEYDFPEKATFNRILQLQTGYQILNAHPPKSWSERISCVCLRMSRNNRTFYYSASHIKINESGRVWPSIIHWVRSRTLVGNLDLLLDEWSGLRLNDGLT